MHSARAVPRRLRVAASLQIAQGALMEGSVAIGLIVLLALRVPQAAITDRVEIFALPYLQENLYLMMAMSGVFASLRIIGGVALWRGRLWGLWLTLVNCVLTLMLMIFMLPPGLVDGLFAGTALVLLLSGWFGDSRIRPTLYSRPDDSLRRATTMDE
ncbi:hypothetical protein [Agrococcus casei]|uniref:hypothetical protein n=1 Tax=Agrococcus casei TaxID=343512 RepID=UPI003F925871